VGHSERSARPRTPSRSPLEPPGYNIGAAAKATRNTFAARRELPPKALLAPKPGDAALTDRPFLSASLFALALIAPPAAFAADASHPTVVELFQSQGCSSCPPAAANVRAISDRPDVLALAFEVDYWDRLGWKDTFSSPSWTARQYAYARAMGRDGVYTPQIVVNGRVEGDGLEADGLVALMREGDRGGVGPDVAFHGDAVSVGAGSAPARGADVWLARYDPRVVEVEVRRGENAGRTLPHKDVVREMVLLGRWDGRQASFPAPADSSGLAEAAIVQEAGGGPILAAAKR
jgi:hypothetical protein